MTEDEVFDNDDAPNFEDSDEFIIGDPADPRSGAEGLGDDDEEFVIEDWDSAGEAPEGGDLASPGPTGSGATPDPFARRRIDPEARRAAGTVAPDEQDMLFGDGGHGEVPENVLGANRTFSEEGGAGWDGDETALDDLGMEMTGSQPKGPVHMAPDFDDGVFDIESEDLILIDADDDVFADEDEGGFYDESGEDEYAGTSASGSLSESDLATSFPESRRGEERAAAQAAPIDAEFQEFAGGLGADLNVDDVGPAVYDDAADEDVQYEDPGIDYNTRDFSTEEAGDEEWAPVSEFDDDDDDEYLGDEEEEGYEEAEYDEADEDPDYSEYEEAYYEDDQAYSEYVETERRSSLRGVVSLAALVVVAGCAAFWYLKPTTTGSPDGEKVIEVIKIGRPRVATVKGPVAKDPTAKDPTAEDPVAKDPTAKDPAAEDPVAKDPTAKDPAAEDPVAKDPAAKDPIAKDPVGKDPAAEDPVAKDPVAKDPTTKDPVAVGPAASDPKRVAPRPKGGADMLQVGGSADTAVSKHVEGLMERHRKWVVEDHNGLVMGSQALAQLYNENIFVGRVKALNGAYVTLRTKDGEITLDRANVRMLTALEDADYEVWRNAASTGLVKLRNNNRLKGKIVQSRDDAVVLMVNANRVIIPKIAIESVSAERRESVNLDQKEAIENDDWFRQLVERRLQERDSGKGKDTAAPSK